VKFEALTVFLNRDCPRGCLQCGLSDGSKRPLSIEKWKEAFQILYDLYGTKFFLFLGTEPLLLRGGLVDLVRWFAEHNLFYGFYSTSPEPLFTKYREVLLEAGLRNWSAGIDALPGMSTDEATKKKVVESIQGLQWMANHGVQTFTVTTIHKRNLWVVPEIVGWLQKNVQGVLSTVNFIEWKRTPEFDFFSTKEQMLNLMWDSSEVEREQVRSVMSRMGWLALQPGTHIQVPLGFFEAAHLHYDRLDDHCGGVLGPGVDCDGTLRLCGYSTGLNVGKWSVFDLVDQEKSLAFERVWSEDLQACSGCHWVFHRVLRDDLRLLDPKSGIYQERWVKE